MAFHEEVHQVYPIHACDELHGAVSLTVRLVLNVELKLESPVQLQISGRRFESVPSSLWRQESFGVVGVVGAENFIWFLRRRVPGKKIWQFTFLARTMLQVQIDLLLLQRPTP
jgi:hypothetical protein